MKLDFSAVVQADDGIENAGLYGGTCVVRFLNSRQKLSESLLRSILPLFITGELRLWGAKGLDSSS